MSNTSLQKIRHLWPGYLNKSLSTDDQAFMDNWMHHHGPAHPEFQDELNWVALTRAQLKQATPIVNPEAGWHELLARIEAEPRPQSAARKATTGGWLQQMLSWLTTPALTTSMAALLVAQSVAVWMLWPGADDSVRLMSSTRADPAASATAAHTITLQVTYKEQATVAQVRESLAAVQGHIDQGPSALGVWRVQVAAMPEAQLTSLVTTLQSQAAVESVFVEQ
jgi:hypothetical protein